MLAHLITSLLKGDTIENRILAISALTSFEFKANDTTSLYMACMRGLQASLQGCTIDQFLSSVAVALAKLDTALHPGLSALFLQGDKDVLAENLRDIESRMECEDQVRVLTGVIPDSVRRAKQKQPTAPSKQDNPSLVATYHLPSISQTYPQTSR